MTMPAQQFVPQQPGAGQQAAPQQQPLPTQAAVPQPQFMLPPTQVFQQDASGQFPQASAWALAAPQQPQVQQPPQQQQQVQQPQPPQQQWQQQPVQQQPPQQQASQPQVPQYAHPAAVVPPNAGFPAELVGRPLAEAMRIYNTMKQGFTLAQQQQPLQAQQPQLPSQGALPQQPRPFVPQGQITPESMAQIVRQEVQQAVAQVTMPTDIQRAASVISQLPHSSDPRVLQIMQNTMSGLQQQAWTDPNIWISAYKMAVGELVSGGQQLRPVQQQQQQPAPQQQLPQQNNVWPQMQQQPNYSQLNAGQPWQPYQAPTGQFFTEQPNGGQQQVSSTSLTPDQRAVAARFKMPEGQYAAWTNGGVPQ